MVTIQDIRLKTLFAITEFRDSILTQLDEYLKELEGSEECLADERNPFLISIMGFSTKQDYRGRFYSSVETKMGKCFHTIMREVVKHNPKFNHEVINCGVDDIIHRCDDGSKIAISVKSGPNWSNSNAWQGENRRFSKVASYLAAENRGTEDEESEIITVVFHAYGSPACAPKTSTMKVDFRVFGQEAWTWLSDNPNLHTQILILMSEGSAEFNRKVEAKLDRINELLNTQEISPEELLSKTNNLFKSKGRKASTYKKLLGKENFKSLQDTVSMMEVL